MESASPFPEKSNTRWVVRARLKNKKGLHARACSIFAVLAKTFTSDIKVIADKNEADGKVMLSLMKLGASEGVALEIIASGEDAVDAAVQLGALVNHKFGESE